MCIRRPISAGTVNEKFDSEYHYCGLDDAVHHFDSCMKFQPVHFCKGGHVGIGDFVGVERVDKND